MNNFLSTEKRFKIEQNSKIYTLYMCDFVIEMIKTIFQTFCAESLQVTLAGPKFEPITLIVANRRPVRLKCPQPLLCARLDQCLRATNEPEGAEEERPQPYQFTRCRFQFLDSVLVFCILTANQIARMMENRFVQGVVNPMARVNFVLKLKLLTPFNIM